MQDMQPSRTRNFCDSCAIRNRAICAELDEREIDLLNTIGRRRTLAAGEQLPIFLDDQYYPHRPNPHFLQWLPLFDTPDAWIICLKGQRPRLIILSSANFWHAEPELPGAAHADV